VHLLQRAMQRLIEDQKRRVPRQVEPNPLSVLERMSEILDLLRSTWSLLFSSVAGAERLRAEWVVTLLALLELVRLGQARARQADLFGEIVIERNAVSVHEPARLVEAEEEGEPAASPADAAPAPAPPDDEPPRTEQGESLNA
jgi:chromatin segregation and condensation protein Rec8/ScpA/Scc1 (kleisin family)